MTPVIFSRRGSGGVQKDSAKLAWRGRMVLDKQGEAIGRIEEIYIAEEAATPDWALVRSDALGETALFLPLQGSRSEGDEVIVPFTKTEVADAPRIQEASTLSPEQGAALYGHYGINEAERRPGNARLDSARERVLAGERRLSEQMSRFGLRLLSVMRGRNDTAPGAKAAVQKPQPVQAKTKSRRTR